MLKVSVEFPFLSQNWLILALLTNLLTGINETGNGTAREGEGGLGHLKKRTPTPPKICYWVLSGTFNWITCSSFSAVWVPRVVVVVVVVVAVATDAAVSWLLCQKNKKKRRRRKDEAENEAKYVQKYVCKVNFLSLGPGWGKEFNWIGNTTPGQQQHQQQQQGWWEQQGGAGKVLARVARATHTERDSSA